MKSEDIFGIIPSIMQDYSYSVFSLVAIAIHLITNFDLLVGRRTRSAHHSKYNGFLFGVLAYYVVDAAWGILAGLGWTRALYVDTILYFLSLVTFVFLLSRFVISYISLDKWMTRILSWYGYAIMVFNVVLLTANFFNNCFFYFDEHGRYLLGDKRYLAFWLQIVFNVLIALFVLIKAIASRDSVRRRSMMVFMVCTTIAVSIALQVILPLTPFTALGCLISNCFFHVFVVQDERTEKHMAELEKALERARAAEKARSMFFSIVSHDIRTPLNAIIGYSELIRHGLESKAERDKALDSICASGTTLLQLVNDVLDLAKMDAGKIILHSEPVRLDSLTEEVFKSCRLVASQKGIDLVNRTADVPPVMLDGHRFRQILFNLIGNAVKFTERGSVTVTASYSGKRLDVSVADTGCGIPPDMLTKIFDPFVQVQDPSLSADRAGGTGLGLSICRRLVETMGGELVVESELGKGSTFSAHIPGVEQSEEKTKSTGVSNDLLTKSALPNHVLIVDDSPVNRAVLEALLAHIGVSSVDEACDGVEALSALESSLKSDTPYDFVFSDLWMPNMNGLVFIDKLRANPNFSKLKVFAVTADAEFDNDERHKLFDGVLLKPITYGKLVETFAKVASDAHQQALPHAS